MDRRKATSNIVRCINLFHNGKILENELIDVVCDYFDLIKDLNLYQSDIKFLKYISNVIGIPHYYDLLNKFQIKNLDINNINLNTFSSMLYETTLHTDENIKVHKYQKYILNEYKFNELNRFFLSASTSFGKTFLIYEIIKMMKYKNIILIFPTIALLSENLENIHNDKLFSIFKEHYKIHTLSDIEEFSEKNIFIYTPERFLSFLEKNPKFKYDFVFVDEIYKLDNDYLINNESKENERDVSYRITLFYILKNNIDVLLAGPYIEMLSVNDEKYNPSFDNFLTFNKFRIIDFNHIEIVKKSIDEIRNKKLYKIDDKLILNLTNPKQKNQKLIDIVKGLKSLRENSIIYCSNKSMTEKYAKVLFDSDIFPDNKNLHEELSLLIEHLSENLNDEWVIIQALKHRIGIHHGLVPKYIQKEIIKLFNDGSLDILLSTTTITEGINTSAKNLIVLQGTKGGKELKKFDAKNIAGRAGRFKHHFTGRVLVLDKEFIKAIESDDVGMHHKNYDENSIKDEIDLFHTEETYINGNDKNRIHEINQMQKDRGIPDDIMNLFKVINKTDKIEIYDLIESEFTTLDEKKMKLISSLKKSINAPQMNIDYDGFQFIINIIKRIIVNPKLTFLIENKAHIDKEDEDSPMYSILIYILSSYLKGGFKNLFNYNLKSRKKKIKDDAYRSFTVDEAVRDASDFIYNTLKYQLVKYLGVFDIMLRYYFFQKTNRKFEKPILNKLITKLEYNALTKEGKLASDYGVPYKIIEYYDSNEKNNIDFDEYEDKIFKRIKSILVEKD